MIVINEDMWNLLSLLVSEISITKCHNQFGQDNLKIHLQILVQGLYHSNILSQSTHSIL